MADLIALSSRIVDRGVADEPVNRITQELSEVADGIAVVESFSHSVILRTGDGLVVFDSSGSATGAKVVESMRQWTADPVATLVYTHGHLDHVGGSPAFVADAERRGDQRPRFVSHAAVRDRFARYRMTDGWNQLINARQFGWLRSSELRIGAGGTADMDPGAHRGTFIPDDVAEPDVVYRDRHSLEVGGQKVELYHARGETDDHTWAWIPSKRAICCGDFLIWNFPNAGNPQKVQRYPAEWASALREMAALAPELLLPAHGLPLAGAERISKVLLEVACVLEDLVAQTVAMMNGGATLDEIIHTVKVPDATLALPYLRPFYDEPEFVVRNVWRLYGGWWDANPARLKPAADRAVAAEVAALAGGAGRLAERARELVEAGQPELACQLAEWAADADPFSTVAHTVRAEVYERRMSDASSLMAKGIFASAARQSRRRLEQPGDPGGRSDPAA